MKIFGGNFFIVRKEQIRWKFFGVRKVGGNFLGLRKGEVRWKFSGTPQGRVLTRIFSMSAREGFVEGGVVVDVVDVVEVDVHVGDVDK